MQQRWLSCTRCRVNRRILFDRAAWLGDCLRKIENHLIALLPRADRARLLARCKPVELLLASRLAEPDTLTRHAYFPTTGFVSLLAPVDGQPALEVGMVGSEGMLGVQLVLGVPTVPLIGLVQGAGSAWQIEASVFRKELARSTSLQHVMNRYIYVLMSQLVTSAICLRYHVIGGRLARWLLMSQDRAHSDKLSMTQEFLSSMLGVRRVGVTAAAGVLQREGLIEYHRGDLTVLDRGGLEAASCICYEQDRRTYSEVLDRQKNRKVH